MSGTELDEAFQAREAAIRSRLDEAERLLALVKAQRWRLFRNGRLLRKVRVLLAENERLLRTPLVLGGQP